MSHIEVGIIPSVPLSIGTLRPRHVHCSPDGKRIVYGAANGVVSRVLPDQIELKTNLVESFIGCKKPLEIAAISPDNNTVIGGDNNGVLYVWTRGKDSGPVKTYNLNMPYVRLTDLAFSDDSQRLAVCGVDKYSRKLGAVILTDAGSAVGKLEGHTLGINSVSFRQKKPFLVATAGVDGVVCLHTGPPFKLLHSCTGHTGQVFCVRFAPNGNSLISCGQDGKVISWSLGTGEIDRDIQVANPSTALYSLAWSTDCERFVTVGVDRTVRIISLTSGQLVAETQIGLDTPETPVSLMGSSMFDGERNLYPERVTRMARMRRVDIEC